ncbi:MAG: LysE family transporter [Oscillospiraceae bacterium]|nr:LysE family transporter [Oscillospiraceae bacterium]
MFHWGQFLSYAGVMAITPGPNNLMSMSNAGRLGVRKAIGFNFGVWLGFSIVALLSAVFCSTLSTLFPQIKLPMLLLGAGYMLFLAWKTFRSSDVEEKSAGKGNFLSGLLLQFVNPKIYLNCIVSMQTYILPHFSGKWLSLIAFALLLAFVGFVCTLLWALFGSAFKLLFSKYARMTNTLMALLLVYCAVSLFL